MDIERLIKDAQDSLRVAPQAAALYLRLKEALLEDVNREMSALPQIATLIGGNPRAMMLDNHRNHVEFMATVFRFNSLEMLVKTLPWVYRSYRARGFSTDYFPRVLEEWKKAVEKHLDTASAREINAVYDWMLRHHEDMIRLSAGVPEEPPQPELVDERRKFRTCLLTADFSGAMNIAEALREGERGQETLFLELIQPVMYEIGRLWERDEISTAEEHLATSMVGRILAKLYARRSASKPSRGKAVVTSAPNEYHEMGARMLADMLEAAGWDILFLGANIPAASLIKLLQKNPPIFLAVSATMPYNIDKVAEIISAIKETDDLRSVKLMVGGQAFGSDQNLWRQIGADSWAADPRSAIKQAEQWLTDKTTHPS